MNTAPHPNQNTKTDAAGNLYHAHPTLPLWVADAEQRLDFLPAYFTSRFMAFENLVYDVAGNTISGYKGGYWQFALSDSELPFVYPTYRSNNDDQERLTVFNALLDHQEDIHPVLAGIHTTMTALLIMISRSEQLGLSEDEEERIYDLRLALQSYALGLGKDLGNEQDRAFFRLID